LSINVDVVHCCEVLCHFGYGIEFCGERLGRPVAKIFLFLLLM
jgi:hypothetical protein